MSQSLSKIYLHIVFSTKDRYPFLDPSICKELYPYSAEVLKNLDCPPIIIGGMSDHLHILCVLSKNISIAKLIEEIKKPTSKLIKSVSFKTEKFSWQNGYGAFSIGQSQVELVRNYIANQEDHHKTISFEEEFKNFLKKYSVSFDERYLLS